MPQRVRMLKTQHGVHDGEIKPVPFVEGEEYDVGPLLLESFIDLGVVELTGVEGEKPGGDAPSNKMMKAGAPANKSK